MKKIGILVVVLGILSACNNTATLETKADSLGKQVDSVSKKVWDSGKKEVKELKEKIEKEFKKNDSASK
jgi:chaperonin cofactor prefoldin